MGITDRLYKMALGRLDKMSKDWDELDPAAQAELDAYSKIADRDALQRAQDKIEQTRQANNARRALRPPDASASRQSYDTLRDLPDGYEPPIPQVIARAPQTIEAAYRILDIPPGSSLADAKIAYQKILKKLAGHIFPEGSREKDQADRIEKRATAAYMLLAENLATEGSRFDRLEI